MPGRVVPNRFGNYDETQFLNAALHGDDREFGFAGELELPEDMSDMMRAYIYKDFETLPDRVPFHPLTVASLLGPEEGMAIALNYVENMARLEHHLNEAKRRVDDNLVQVAPHVFYVEEPEDPHKLFYHIVDSKLYGHKYNDVVAHYNTSTRRIRFASTASQRLWDFRDMTLDNPMEWIYDASASTWLIKLIRMTE